MSIHIFQPVSTSDLLHALLDSEPGAGLASYFDAVTAHVIEMPTRGEVLDALIGQRVTLPTRAVLVEMIENGDLAGTQNGRAMSRTNEAADAHEWDRLVVNLSGQPNPEQAREIIIEQLRHPAIAWRKNLGRGRFHDMKFSGARTVFADPVHTDPDEGPNFQAFIHTYAITGGLVSSKVSFLDSLPRAALQAQINAALTAAGLNPLDVAGMARPISFVRP